MRWAILITDGLRIAHLKIAPPVGNPEVGNPDGNPELISNILKRLQSESVFDMAIAQVSYTGLENPLHDQPAHS